MSDKNYRLYLHVLSKQPKFLGGFATMSEAKVFLDGYVSAMYHYSDWVNTVLQGETEDRCAFHVQVEGWDVFGLKFVVLTWRNENV